MVSREWARRVGYDLTMILTVLLAMYLIYSTAGAWCILAAPLAALTVGKLYADVRLLLGMERLPPSGA